MGQTNKKHIQRKKRSVPNRIYWTSIFLGVVASASIGGIIFNNYEKTLHWDNKVSGITMAKQSLDLLYDSNPTSKANKIKFAKLRATMLNKDGSLTKDATKNNVNLLKSYLSRINTANSTTNYKKQYGEIALKYSIQAQFDSLFTDSSHTTLKQSVTPQVISNLNNSTFDDLSKLFVINPNDKFVKNTIDEENKLGSDILTFNKLVTLFTSNTVITKKYITLKPGYHENLTDKYNTLKSKLKYNWNLTKYMDNLVTILLPVVNKTIKRYDKYNAYTLDIRNKKEAYAEWKEQQDDFFASLKTIHQNAVTEKHRQEELAREQSAAASSSARQSSIDSENASIASSEAESESQSKAASISSEQASEQAASSSLSNTSSTSSSNHDSTSANSTSSQNSSSNQQSSSSSSTSSSNRQSSNSSTTSSISQH